MKIRGSRPAAQEKFLDGNKSAALMCLNFILLLYSLVLTL